MRIGDNGGGPLIAQDITIKLTSTGVNASTPAPVIYSVDVGYTEMPALMSPT